ncbi:hypothetical protein ACWGCW_31515 [Streptomyces sp. NPDC054933]
MKVWPFRIVRTTTLDELRDDTLWLAAGQAAALFVLQRTQAQKDNALADVDQAVDDLQVHILRRALAVELLQEITDVPPEAAVQIRNACDALIRGGEAVPA